MRIPCACSLSLDPQFLEDAVVGSGLDLPARVAWNCRAVAVIVNDPVFGALIGQHLRGKRCEAFTANMRVLATASGLYTYPDLSVACEEPQFADAQVDSLTNPALLVEILSPSTEDYDRGKKAKLYRAIPSLQELLLIAQDSYEVELYRRQADGSWSLMEAKGLEAGIALTSIGYTLSLRELYEKVLGDSENA